MSFWNVIYNLLIGPLELFFEVIYVLAYRVVGHPGWAIVVLSLTINFLVLPLYRRADIIQKEEALREAKLQPWVKKIKKTFKGDEQYMMLQTYYRQNDYKPTYVLKSAVSLFLQIPFFMAAYRFLSHLEMLQGVQFGPIKDFGAPDAMFVVAGFTINILPILMTLINIVSSLIYTRGMPLKTKLQLYMLAGFFLVFLYKSPAGLVFYWTLNNVFSLLKNVFYKLKNPRLVLSVIASLVSISGILYLFIGHPIESKKKMAFLLVFLIALQIPIVLYFVKKKYKNASEISTVLVDNKTYFLGAAFLSVLVGLLVPSAVINASPIEFINTTSFENPLIFVFSAFITAVGTFFVWFTVFYMLADKSGKKTLASVVAGLSGVAIVDYMAFGKEYGTISNSLRFDLFPSFTIKQIAINLLVVLAVFVVLFLISKKKSSLINIVYVAAILAVGAMSVMNITQIDKTVSAAEDNIKKVSQQVAKIPLSKEGNNVVVLIMDRATSVYFPYLMNEKSELQEKYNGFTYYPNTLSYGPTTNIAIPAVYGGYEYTPLELNKRSNEKLVEKHNEALLMLPTLFSKNGYNVVECDPPYANYQTVSDLSIYDDLDNTNAYITKGKLVGDSTGIYKSARTSLQRNIFCYSVFKVAPTCLQELLYANGSYNSSKKFAVNENSDWLNAEPQQTRDGNSYAVGVDKDFTNAYTTIMNLSTITDITNDKKGTFVTMLNGSTHEPVLLQEPEYVPKAVVDNRDYDAEHGFVKTDAEGNSVDLYREGHTSKTTDQIMHYQIYVASFTQIANWLDYLRDEGVYDNTRIIIVSDHGRDFISFDDRKIGTESRGQNTVFYNPLLLVKDFNSTDALKADETFMTNADVPTIATKGVIDNPVNPFTGKPIDSSQKSGEQYVMFSTAHNVSKNNGNKFIPGEWYSVHDDVRVMSNWSELGDSLN